MPITVDMDISAWIAKAKGKTREFAIECIQDLNEAVVGAPTHPVKTGFLRASWYASFDEPLAQPADSPDPGGGATVARLNLTAASLQVGQTYFAVNGASYAYYVEYGTSKMAPRAFVRGPLANWAAIADAAAVRVAARS